MNENKKAVKFFTKWQGAGPVGIGCLGVGALFLWLGGGMFSWFASIGLFIIGIALFLYGNIGSTTEAQLFSDVKKACEKIAFPELEEDVKMSRRSPKFPEELVYEDYTMRQGLYFKKRKDASVFSSEYYYVKIAVLNDAFYAKTATASLVSPEVTYKTHDILFDSIQNIEFTSQAFNVGNNGKSQFRVKSCYIVISYGDGKQLLLPAKDDAYVDNVVHSLKKKAGMV